MRIWTLHPQYLDGPGLSGAWKEIWLAWSVLDRPEAGYGRHPELKRWKAARTPRAALARHIRVLWREALRRGWNPKDPPEAAGPVRVVAVLPETVLAERDLLLEKLRQRGAADRYEALSRASWPKLSSAFKVVESIC